VYSANNFLSRLSDMDVMRWKDTFMRHAAENNRQAEVCFDTMEKMENGMPISDTEILGLAWAITHDSS